jgi:sporulation protein YlmC with PRC-barrel domain
MASCLHGRDKKMSAGLFRISRLSKHPTEENENIKYISKAKQEFFNFTGGSYSIETVDFSLIRAINNNIIVMDRIVMDDEDSSNSACKFRFHFSVIYEQCLGHAFMLLIILKSTLNYLLH